MRPNPTPNPRTIAGRAPPRATRSRLALAAVGLALVLPAAALRGDVIILRNGNQIQGEILRRAERSITVQFPGGIVEVPWRDIERIESESRTDYLLAEGEKHLLRRDFEGGIRFLRSAIDENPRSTVARERLLDAQAMHGEALLDQGRFEDARKVFSIVLTGRPDDAPAAARLREIDAELRRADQEESRGLTEVQTGDAESGCQRLRRLYDRFPERRERLAPALGRGLIALAYDALEQRQIDRAESLFLEAVALEPDLVGEIADGYVAIKIVQLREPFQLGEHQRLLDEAESALDIVPTSLPLVYFRGHALEGLGRRKEAAAAYLSITGERPRGDPVRNIDAIKRAAEGKLLGKDGAANRAAANEILPGDWRTLRTDHFVIYHRNNTVAAEVARVAEATYDRLHRLLGLGAHFYRPCLIYLHPRQADFQSVGGKHQWTGGSHRITSQRGTLAEHRIETYQTQPRLAQTVIPHEIGHAMLAHKLRYRAAPPLWLNEGFAVWIEPEFVHRYHEQTVQYARQSGRLLPASELFTATGYPDEDRVKIFYAQCFSLTKLLIKAKGLETFLRFTEEAALSPSSLDALIERHYGLAGSVGLENYWRSSVELGG